MVDRTLDHNELPTVVRDIDFRRKLLLTIFHGASAVGKSYSVNRLKENFSDVISIEMDDLIEVHMSGVNPEFKQEIVAELVGSGHQRAFVELAMITSKESVRAQRCIAFLLSRLLEQLRDAEEAAGSSTFIISTCGALPFPRYHTNLSIYQWLETWVDISVVHLLLDPDPEVHLERIEKRDRIHLKDKIIANWERRRSTADRYDFRVSSYEELKEVIEFIDGKRTGRL